MSGTMMKPIQKLPVACERGPGQHGADHEEVAVRDVDDVEQAENDGEAERDERDDQAPDQAVQSQAAAAYPSCANGTRPVYELVPVRHGLGCIGNSSASVHV